MLIGQMAFNRKSEVSDYVQLDMCGLNKEDAITKFNKFSNDTSVILHGDWTKNGASENNIVKEERINDYVEIIKYVDSSFKLLGVTVHPPFKNKVNKEAFLEVVKFIETETGVSIFIENRSNHKIHFSEPIEVIELTNCHNSTIDIPQLYISCGCKEDLFFATLESLNWNNVKEIHLANLKKDGSRSYVGRKLSDIEGVIDIKKVVDFIKGKSNPYYTLEILGGVPTFEREQSYLKSL